MLDPNVVFKGKAVRMMSADQRIICEKQCQAHGISLLTLTTKALGKRKRTRDLTHLDAARCIATSSANWYK